MIVAAELFLVIICANWFAVCVLSKWSMASENVHSSMSHKHLESAMDKYEWIILNKLIEASSLLLNLKKKRWKKDRYFIVTKYGN